MKSRLVLLIIIGVFVAHALSMNFTQDDAFISYRYVKNFIGGNGLVFNPGERVEGFTNFFWIVILSLFAQLGFDMVLVSKVLGIAAGAMTLFIAHQMSGIFFRRELRFFSVFVPLLLASNSAFAYWSISGLETVLFVMAVLLSVYLYLTNERLMIISAAISSLIRPEGILVFGILITHKLFLRKNNLKNCLWYILGFALLLVPFLIFRILYYGDFLPNPFYAKTGFSFEYLKSGVAYFWIFLKHYGLWGVLYLIPISFYKNLGVKGKLILLLIYVYTLYVVKIGGDVLKAHRFFLPILPFLYLLFNLALMRLHLALKKGLVNWVILISLVLAFSISTFFLPRGWIMDVRQSEIGLHRNMSRYAERLTQSVGNDFSLAVSTIGTISYLTEAKVIDMLGLTDSYIAKHPEKTPGILSTWKEKRFNTQYLLSLNPDVIMFSTGVKPSAPAERALFLSSKFRENYYPYYFLEKILLVVYRKRGEYIKDNRVFPDVRFVNLYNQAINLEYQDDYLACLNKLEEALEVGPKDFPAIYEHMSRCHYKMGNLKDAKKYALKAVEMDDYCTLAHILLHEIYLQEGDSTVALKERDKILSLNPEAIQLK